VKGTFAHRTGLALAARASGISSLNVLVVDELATFRVATIGLVSSISLYLRTLEVFHLFVRQRIDDNCMRERLSTTSRRNERKIVLFDATQYECFQTMAAVFMTSAHRNVSVQAAH